LNVISEHGTDFEKRPCSSFLPVTTLYDIVSFTLSYITVPGVSDRQIDRTACERRTSTSRKYNLNTQRGNYINELIYTKRYKWYVHYTFLRAMHQVCEIEQQIRR